MRLAMRRVLPSLLALLFLTAACASVPREKQQRSDPARARASGVPLAADSGATVVDTALKMLGAPYRYGGASPRGFDCSGLVVYSYGKAGYPGLPHSAARLAELSRPIAVRDLQPGDLMFFELAGKKPSHVGIYVGNRKFIHAPSSGGRVEIVDFDHVYWRRHIGKAGRLLEPASTVAQLR